jgi:hypothetical protein
MRIAKVLAALAFLMTPALADADRRVPPGEALMPTPIAPVLFHHLDSFDDLWELRPVSAPKDLPGLPSDRWYALGDYFNHAFLLCCGRQGIRLHLPEDGFPLLGTIPLDVKPGMTWTSRRTYFKANFPAPLSCRCTADRIDVSAESRDTLRVDFLSSRKNVHQSIWFAPGVGLLRWTNPHFGTIERWSGRRS